MIVIVTLVTLMLSAALAHAGTIVYPDGTTAQTFTNQRGITTIQPQVGLPTLVFPAPKAGDPAMIMPPSGRPTFAYPDSPSTRPSLIAPTMPRYTPTPMPSLNPYPDLTPYPY